jgi:hypothetical protein
MTDDAYATKDRVLTYAAAPFTIHNKSKTLASAPLQIADKCASIDEMIFSALNQKRIAA